MMKMLIVLHFVINSNKFSTSFFHLYIYQTGIPRPRQYSISDSRRRQGRYEGGRWGAAGVGKIENVIFGTAPNFLGYIFMNGHPCQYKCGTINSNSRN